MDFCLRCNAWHDGLGCPINAEIARLRAALAKERAFVDCLIDACDEYFGFPKNPVRDTELKEVVNAVRARRAAEAKEPT